MASGPCPACGVENRVFFGDVLGVEVCANGVMGYLYNKYLILTLMCRGIAMNRRLNVPTANQGFSSKYIYATFNNIYIVHNLEFLIVTSLNFDAA